MERKAVVVAKDIEAKSHQRDPTKEALPRAFQAKLLRVAQEANEGRLTLARAEEWIREFHQLANPDYERISLDGHVRNWIGEQAGHVSDKTLEIYHHSRTLMVEGLGKRVANGPVDELKDEQVRKALAKIRKGHAASTTNQTLRNFRRAMEAAVRQGLCPANPAGTHIKPYPEKDTLPRAPFTREEFATLLSFTRDAYNHDEWCGAILIGGHTGLRLGDVLNLTTKNVHDGRFVVETTKTGDVVEVPITPPVHAWIGEKKGAFFPILGSKGTSSISTTFTRILARAGIPRDVELPGRDLPGRRSFHSLRHSFASWLADADVHSDVRKKLTGHKSDGIHAGYTHHDEALERAVESLPGA